MTTFARDLLVGDLVVIPPPEAEADLIPLATYFVLQAVECASQKIELRCLVTFGNQPPHIATYTVSAGQLFPRFPNYLIRKGQSI